MQIVSRPFLRLLCFLLFVCLLCPPLTAAETPNIVLILADDLGHGHISSFNPKSKIQTPHVDRLAREGIILTDAHSGSAVCSPTRYGLLTGRYAWRTKLVRGVLQPYDPPLIEAGRLTLPAMLKQQGYATACIGKWHLGWDWPLAEGADTPDFTQPIAGGPTTRGFDDYFGTHVPNHPPYCFIANDRTVGQPTAMKTVRDLDGRPGPMLPGWKFDAILPELGRRSAAYIQEHAKADKKFFLYLALTSPHEPIAPSAEFRGKSGLNALGDFVIETDAVVGTVLDAIERAGIADDTLVIYTADNGSSLYTGGRELQAMGHEPSAGWRGFKSSIYEGGHRVPFVARWPGHIAPGSQSERTICLTDLMATLGELTGAKFPDNAAEDSFSMLPVLLGMPDASERPAVVHQSSTGRLAIRQGPWKLVLPGALVRANLETAKTKAKNAKANEPTERELYHLADDAAETNDIIAEHPDVETRLAALYKQFRETGRSRPYSQE